jgi:hypothetical protein
MITWEKWLTPAGEIFGGINRYNIFINGNFLGVLRLGGPSSWINGLPSQLQIVTGEYSCGIIYNLDISCDALDDITSTKEAFEKINAAIIKLLPQINANVQTPSSFSTKALEE